MQVLAETSAAAAAASFASSALSKQIVTVRVLDPTLRHHLLTVSDINSTSIVSAFRLFSSGSS